MVDRAAGYLTQHVLIGITSVLVFVLYFLQLLVEWRVKRQRVTYDVYQKYRTARLEAVRRSGGRHTADEQEDTETTETELTEVKSTDHKKVVIQSPKSPAIRISVSSEELMPPTTSSRSNLDEPAPAPPPPIARQWSLSVKKPSKAIPPPDVGKIPWLFHRCGLAIGLLFVVRLVDPWGLEGWYPQSFLDLDSTLATLILYFASCYTVNQFVTLRYNSMSSQPPPTLPITIFLANITTWLVLLFALFWRMAQRESWLLGIHYAYIAFAEAFLTLIFDVATIFLSYKISGLTRQQTERAANNLPDTSTEPKVEEKPKKKRKAKGEDNSTASVGKVIVRMRVFAVCMTVVIAVAVAFNLNSAIDSFKKGTQFVDAPEPDDAASGYSQTAVVLLDNAVALLGFWYSYMPLSYLWKNFFPNLDLDIDENYQYFKKFGVLQGEYVAALTGVPVSSLRPKASHNRSRSGSNQQFTPNNSREVV